MMIYIMQVVVVAFAAVVLGVGILATNHEETPSSQSTVLAEETERSTASPLANATTEASPTQTPANAMNSYIYPNATISHNSDSRVELATSDSSNTVTDWYRTMIKQQGFSITSAVKTATNGVVNNTLVGSENGETITISITQNEISPTKIVVEL